MTTRQMSGTVVLTELEATSDRVDNMRVMVITKLSRESGQEQTNIPPSNEGQITGTEIRGKTKSENKARICYRIQVIAKLKALWLWESLGLGSIFHM